MKVDLSKLDMSSFMSNSHVVAGEEVQLIQPIRFPKWTKESLIYRSSVWTKDGQPVSLSFKKFFNWGEQPDVTPLPKSLKNCHIVEKIDGSTLIVSCYKGELIARTRGTLDASLLPHNGNEVNDLLTRYPNIRVFALANPEVSYLFEWVTNNTDASVVIKHSEPDLYLTGAVNHDDYSMMFQSSLDNIAEAMRVKRPERHSFDDVDQMLEAIRVIKNKEGICIYYNGDQNILKVKSEWYLALHKFKENCHDEPIIDLFLEYGRPEYTKFIEQLTTCFDYECMNMARSIASRVCDAAKNVEKIVAHMKQFAEDAKKLPTRKEQAEKIIKAYGDTSRSSFVFNLLDGREFDNKSYKKLLFQSLK